MASRSTYQSLLQWRPRYCLPACVSRLGLDPTALRSRLAMVLGTLTLLSWIVACWTFHDQMTAPGQEATRTVVTPLRGEGCFLEDGTAHFHA